MFGLTIEKLVVIAVIAAFIIGPERLPLYAGRVAGFVRGLRDLADSAKLRVKEELGDEYDTVEWTKLDPRQYDPRRIVREALSDSAPRETAGAPAFEPGGSCVGVGRGCSSFRAGPGDRVGHSGAVVRTRPSVSGVRTTPASAGELRGTERGLTPPRSRQRQPRTAAENGCPRHPPDIRRPRRLRDARLGG
jgi:sec-independent protein translocase protein TatB